MSALTSGNGIASEYLQRYACDHVVICVATFRRHLNVINISITVIRPIRGYRQVTYTNQPILRSPVTILTICSFPLVKYVSTWLRESPLVTYFQPIHGLPSVTNSTVTHFWTIAYDGVGGGGGNASTGNYTEAHGPSNAVVFFENPTAVTSFVMYRTCVSPVRLLRKRVDDGDVRRYKGDVYAWPLMWVRFPINALKREEVVGVLLMSMARDDEK
ncbi:unnamed protein product [Trichogramma brassicae]|uniref:Uncharacterized protein n=1 Tax=Trichogramma brassicae TaxID=86971 RepID=A0A6H5IZP5_9HYME|nr:unnamed protein product [Trichogramma brassicae]